MIHLRTEADQCSTHWHREIDSIRTKILVKYIEFWPHRCVYSNEFFFLSRLMGKSTLIMKNAFEISPFDDELISLILICA